MRFWKCPHCRAKIKGIQTSCPECNKKFVCKCGKELQDNKFRKCPICRQELSEKRKRFWGKVAGGVAGVAAAAGTAYVLHEKFSSNDSNDSNGWDDNGFDDFMINTAFLDDDDS